MALIFHLGLRIHARGDFVSDFPQLPVKNMLLTLPKNVHRPTSRTQDIAADDAMRKLYMIEPKELNALVEVEQLLGDFMKAEEIMAASIELLDTYSTVIELIEKRLSQSGSKVN